VSGRDPLTARVLELLRRHRRRHERLVDEQAARSRLYPRPRQIDVSPLSPPLNQQRRLKLSTAAAASREQPAFEDAQFTG
jgi:hypothetical protein